MIDYKQKLIIKIAELYHKQDLTQQQIADKLNISRTKVSRRLSTAKRKGIIEVKINYPHNTNTELETKLEQELSLKEAVVVSTADDSYNPEIYNNVCKIAAEYLSEKIKDHDNIGISWGETLKQTVGYVDFSKKEANVIQMIGNMGSADVSSDEIARELSKSFEGKYHKLPAPAIVDSESIKDSLMSDKTIKKCVTMMDEIIMAWVGIGGINKKSSFYTHNYFTDQDLKKLQDKNIVGETCGCFYDKDGAKVDSNFNNRIVGINCNQLHQIPYVIAVASGLEKAEAIAGVTKSGVIDVLITDQLTAKSAFEI